MALMYARVARDAWIACRRLVMHQDGHVQSTRVELLLFGLLFMLGLLFVPCSKPDGQTELRAEHMHTRVAMVDACSRRWRAPIKKHVRCVQTANASSRSLHSVWKFPVGVQPGAHPPPPRARRKKRGGDVCTGRPKLAADRSEDGIREPSIQLLRIVVTRAVVQDCLAYVVGRKR